MGKKKAAAKSDSGVNKSQAIRDALAKNPDASPKQLSAELTSKGVKVSPAYVSIIKSGLKSKGKHRKTRAVGARSTVIASDLLEAKKLVDRVGSIENVQSLLGTLKKLL